MQNITVHTRVIELGVNAVLNLMGNSLALTGVEALLVVGHALKHLEKQTGLTYDDLLKQFSPDQKIGLVPTD